MYDNRMNGENSFHDVCDGELERVAFNWFHPFSLEPVPNMNKHIEKAGFKVTSFVKEKKRDLGQASPGLKKRVRNSWRVPLGLCHSIREEEMTVVG
ncbi:hypothetical protein OUZ56_004952 [Daphnia magna]|uniref:Uncharacterized protein n=1 Tax=Daphnia magna TaxID=35525 RepID=A0ABQ9YRF2_9CRUS|nr:hypothetical protein OUZ56_004952 [Daphnia magna]